MSIKTADEILEAYSNFVFGMSEDHFDKFFKLSRRRKDYLFGLWLEGNS